MGSVVTLPHGASRFYVRDPRGRYPASSLASRFKGQAVLPNDARYTGFHRGNWQLWLSASQIDRAVYMKNGSDVEAWPYADNFAECE